MHLLGALAEHGVVNAALHNGPCAQTSHLEGPAMVQVARAPEDVVPICHGLKTKQAMQVSASKAKPALGPVIDSCNPRRLMEHSIVYYSDQSQIRPRAAG